MEKSHARYSCVRCEKTDMEAPILNLRFMGEEAAVCSSCLPVLIHRPDLFIGRLAGAERIEPSSHAHD